MARSASSRIRLLALLAGAASLANGASAAESVVVETVVNPGGPTLRYAAGLGVGILKVDGLSFKDLNRNGKLDRYEDWRLPAAERARDLASKMSLDEIAGLMLYSGHQGVPAVGVW